MINNSIHKIFIQKHSCECKTYYSLFKLKKIHIYSITISGKCPYYNVLTVFGDGIALSKLSPKNVKIISRITPIITPNAYFNIIRITQNMELLNIFTTDEIIEMPLRPYSAMLRDTLSKIIKNK